MVPCRREHQSRIFGPSEISVDRMSLLHSAVLNPLHSTTILLFLLTLGGLSAAVLASFAVVAFSRRQSRPYLLVTLALVALVCKALAGVFTVIGVFSVSLHHLMEHALDFTMALMLIAAIYSARTRPSDIQRRLKS